MEQDDKMMIKTSIHTVLSCTCHVDVNVNNYYEPH